MEESSVSPPRRKLSVPQIMSMKGVHPIVCLTAYTAPMARLLDRHADLLLVGDSLGMVVYGMPNTLNVSMRMMIDHSRAVSLSSARACVVVDMPFRSFEGGCAEAFDNAARLIGEGGASAVKLEGGVEMQETIGYLTGRGIAVMGHVGLLPQRVNAYGGFKVQGKDIASHSAFKADALAVQEAGAFAVVLESIVSDLADEISASLKIPTIGIGASVNCDGQVLVCDDLLGFDGGFVPRFVERYADLNGVIDRAVAQFAADVRERKFPEARHCFGIRRKRST